MSTSVHKRRSSSFLSLACGCTDSKSVLVPGSSGGKSTLTPPQVRRVGDFSSADTLTLTSETSFSSYEEDDAEVKTQSSASTPSFPELLRQLNELEQRVLAWGSHASSLVDSRKEEKRVNCRRSSHGGRRAGDGVVVVKETEDPLGEFRRSMLHMIVEKEIVDGAGLRELLRWFLALNSPQHHGTILRAFADVWQDVFSGYEQTPYLLRHGYSSLPPRRYF
ncbi:hypothetical protein OPV22_002259 [Ensete ventricosum]|uniref:Transcription repressor n=1 Tax=Ensete ventricosum TaxID=4639 RepID=A0AAV8RXH5_ENSVE|nr:hypothetical protein OPV22_002259 [Ensete ventricosum]RWV87025.1 hypothetical protein GW17_00051024 [Ensete ventricosum]RZR82075.1 hypothetical protein BHM03_00008418 [Ensete ventricosum]